VFFIIAHKVDIIYYLCNTILQDIARSACGKVMMYYIKCFSQETPPMEQKKTRAKGAGRKPLPPEDRAKVISCRLTEAQHKRFIELGGVTWLRQQIDKA